jgi:hypothetical protein
VGRVLAWIVSLVVAAATLEIGRRQGLAWVVFRLGRGVLGRGVLVRRRQEAAAAGCGDGEIF